MNRGGIAELECVAERGKMKCFEAISAREDRHRCRTAAGPADLRNHTLVAVEQVAVVVIAHEHHRFAGDKT